MTITRPVVALTAVSLVAGLVGVATSFNVEQFGMAGIILLSGVTPAALGTAVALWVLPRHIRFIVVPLFLIGIAASSTMAVAWSVGFDEADAGGPRSALGASFIPAAITAFVLLAIALAIAAISLLRLKAVSRIVVGTLIGLVGAPVVMASAFAYAYVVGISLVLLLLLVTRRAKRITREPHRAPNTRAVRRWAIVSLAITVVSLGGGLLATLSLHSIDNMSLNGSDPLTSAMAMMAGGGNLAAVPLMIALTLLLAPGSRVAALGLVIGSLGVGAASVAWALGTDLSGGGFVVLPLSVGLWAATAAWSLVPFETGSRATMSILIGLGTAIAYLLFVLGTAGGSLALVSGFLAFRGLRRRRMQPAPV